MYYLELIDYSFIYILISFIFIILLFLYNKKLSSMMPVYKLSLLFLRFISFLILLILLFNPILVNENIQNKMNLGFIIDNSKSMNFWNNIEEVKKNIINFELINKNQLSIKYFVFGDSLKSIENINSINYTDNTTNYQKLFSKINNVNVDELILISDGIQTSGFDYNDTFTSNKIINIWGIGEIITNEDLSILNCQIDTIYNDIVELNIQIESNLINDNIFDITIKNENNNKNIYTSNIENGNFISNHKVKVKKSFFSKYNILNISSNINDFDISNNSHDLLLDDEILESPKILLLSGNLSNNTGKIKSIIKSDNSSIEHYYKLNSLRWNIDIPTLILDDYKLIVLDNFPLTDSDYSFLIDNEILQKNKFVYFFGNIDRRHTKLVNEFLNIYGYNLNIEKKPNENLISNLSMNNNISSLISKIPKSKTYYSIKLDRIDENVIAYTNGNVLIDSNLNNLFVFLSDLSLLSNQAFEIHQQDVYRELLDFYINKLKNNYDIKIYSEKNIYNIDEDCIIYFNDIANINNLYLNVIDNEKNSSINYNNSQLVDGIHNFFININNVSDYSIQLYVDMKSSLKLNSNILNIKSDIKSPEVANLNYNENVLKSIAYNSNGKYVHINNIDTFFNSFIINKKNKIIKNRYNVFTFHKYWIILILMLLIEWYLRKNKGLL